MTIVSAVAPPAPNLYDVNEDGEVSLNFHPGQWRAWEADERFVVVLAGTQSGKTSFLPWWLYREIERAGPGDYLIAAPTFKILEPKILPTFLEVFSRLLDLGTFVRSPVMKFTFSADGARRTFGDRYDPSGPPTVVYFGHASNPDSLESATYKAAALDEVGQDDFKQGSWEAILRRLALATREGFGRVFLGTTVYNLGWIKAILYDKAKTDPSIKIIHFDSTENPRFPKAEFRRAREALPKWKFDMFYRGLFTRPAGMIYDSYDEDRHEVPRASIEIPDDWKRYMGVDFGPVNTAAVFLAERPTDKKLILYRTYHAGGRTAKQHVVQMLSGEPKFKLPLAYGGARSEQDWRNDFGAAGLPIAPVPIIDVEVGILRVWGVHKRNDMLVFNDLDEYRAEKLSYSRELDANDEPTEKIKDKHAFHLMDAERYILASIRPGVDPPGDQPGRVIRETGSGPARSVSIIGRPLRIDEDGRVVRGTDPKAATPAVVTREVY